MFDALMAKHCVGVLRVVLVSIAHSLTFSSYQSYDVYENHFILFFLRQLNKRVQFLLERTTDTIKDREGLDQTTENLPQFCSIATTRD